VGDGHLPVPPGLAANARREGKEDWLARLDTAVTRCRDQWSLDLGPPFLPGGTSAWVAPARDASGADVVLKVGWRHIEAEHEADGLRRWDGDGAVRLLDASIGDDTVALLLERCLPGTPLATRPEPEQDEVVAAMLPRLWIAVPPDHPFRTLQAMCDDWAERLARRRAETDQILGATLVDAALELFHELPSTATRTVLLCTDLHRGNVLAATRAPWLVVDPKPHVGDPTYDVVQQLLNGERLRREPHVHIERMADRLDLDAHRLRRWTFARCVQEAARWAALADVARQLADSI
jgi:streptomycin 6-kinase